MFKLSDFKVGQTAYVEVYRTSAHEKPIEEWTITKVGRKYVTAKYIGSEVQFMNHDLSYGGLIEKTNYSVSYVLYPTKEAIERKYECENLYKDIVYRIKECYYYDFTLEELRLLRKILEHNIRGE